MTNVTKGADDGESINAVVDEDGVEDDDGGGVADADGIFQEPPWSG